MLYGHEGVARDLTDLMTARLPHWIATLRTERGATLEQLPDPALVKPYFVPQLDVGKYPAFIITELDTPTGVTGSRGISNGTPYTTYGYNYPFRVWVYVRGTTYGDVELQLKRYLTAIRATLLENVILASTATHYAEFNPDTIASVFMTPDEDARSALGAGYVGVVVKTDEATNRPNLEPFTIDHGIGAPATQENPDGHMEPGAPIHSANDLTAAEFDPNQL